MRRPTEDMDHTNDMDGMTDKTMRQVRAYCDGELPAADTTAFEQRLADDAALRHAVASERALRERVAVVMGASETPADLKARVRAAMAAAPDEQASGGSAPVGRITRSPGPPHMSVLAIAASVVLIVGAVLFGIFGPQIGTRPSTPPFEQPINNLVRFTSQEHGRCAGDVSTRTDKAAWTDPSDASAKLSAYLGAPVTVPDLAAVGYAFVGAGECKVPGVNVSGHMIFARLAKDAPPAMASLFIVPNDGQCDMPPWREGTNWRLLDDATLCEHKVLALADDDLVWILVACDPTDQYRLASAVEGAITGVR